MNNEEKILEMLTKLTEKVDSMDGRLDRLESNQAEMQANISTLKSNQAEMQETLTRVAVTQEGVVLTRIQTTLEGYSELNRKVGTLATQEQVEDLAADVDVIKAVVTRHSGDINKLKKAQ